MQTVADHFSNNFMLPWGINTTETTDQSTSANLHILSINHVSEKEVLDALEIPFLVFYRLYAHYFNPIVYHF